MKGPQSRTRKGRDELGSAVTRMVIFGSRMERPEEPSFWSRIRPSWVVPKMVERVEEKKKPEETRESPVPAGGTEGPLKEKKDESSRRELRN